MGMFDTIHLKVSIPDDIPYIIPPEWGFQTKSMDSQLLSYEIRNDGLYKRHDHYEDDPTEMYWDPLLEEDVFKSRFVHTTYSKVEDFHGDITLYSSFKVDDDSRVWIELNARFTDGIFTRLTTVRCSVYENSRNVTYTDDDPIIPKKGQLDDL
jgi:hypothetical protein